MNRKTALGAAAGLTLTMVGGVSALFLTIGQAAPAPASQSEATNQAVVTEYVDQFGNPIDPAALAPSAPEIVFVNPDGTQIQAQPSSAEPAAAANETPQLEMEAAYQEPAYEEDEYEEDEYEEYEEEEDHDDYEEEDDD